MALREADYRALQAVSQRRPDGALRCVTGGSPHRRRGRVRTVPYLATGCRPPPGRGMARRGCGRRRRRSLLRPVRQPFASRVPADAAVLRQPVQASRLPRPTRLIVRDDRPSRTSARRFKKPAPAASTTASRCRSAAGHDVSRAFDSRPAEATRDACRRRRQSGFRGGEDGNRECAAGGKS